MAATRIVAGGEGHQLCDEGTHTHTHIIISHQSAFGVQTIQLQGQAPEFTRPGLLHRAKDTETCQ